MENPDLAKKIFASGVAIVVVAIITPIGLGKTTPQEMFKFIFGKEPVKNTITVRENSNIEPSTTNKIEIIKADIDEAPIEVKDIEDPKKPTKRRTLKQDEDLDHLLHGRRSLIARQTRQDYNICRLES